MKIQVATTEEFLKAIQVEDQEITLLNSLLIPQSVQLAPGVTITATREKLGFLSFPYGDGIGIQANNTIKNIVIQTKVDGRAIYVNSLKKDLGKIQLKNLRITGQIQILLRGHNQNLDLTMEQVDIIAADTRLRMEKNLANQLSVSQGALTLFNCSSQSDSIITATLKNITIGRHEAPVIGAGIFIAGFNETAGKVKVDFLSHGDIFSNGMIQDAQLHKSSGAVCILEGVHVKEILSEGPLTSYGAHDHVIYNWGTVDRWTVKGAVRSHGQHAEGLLNKGEIGFFKAEKMVETFGTEACALALHGGKLEEGYFLSMSSSGKDSYTLSIKKEAILKKLEIEETIEHKGEGGGPVKIEEGTSLSEAIKEQLISYI